MKNPSIAILDLIGLVYDGSTLSKKGLGGSESAVILMSKELAKLGFPVTVFNACNYDDAVPGIYDGVTYRPIEGLTQNEKFDIMIVSRTVVPFVPEHMYEAFDTATKHRCKLFESIRKNAKMKILWMHDTFCNGDHAVEDLTVNGYIDKIFTLSDFHTAYISGCDHGGNRRNFEVLKNKIFMTRNGMVKYFDEVDIAAKDKNLFVYNASLTKGMIPLIDKIWPKIKQYIPEAKLKVIGGFYQFRSDAPLDEQGQRHQVISKEKKYKDIDIEFTGIISQKEIATILSKANFFIFPCAFPETFGISTLEALAYNVPILATRFGALEETAIENSSYFIDYAIEPNGLFPNINGDHQVDRFVRMTLEAYHNPYLHQQKQYHCNIIKDICGWDTVALQWKQLFLKTFNMYMDADEYRKVTYVNDKVHRVFGRRFSNFIEWNARKENIEQRIYVISPFFNGKEYLEPMIRSVATQDYKNYHHIIIDDCSTDGSYEHILDVVSSLPDELQNKFTIVKNKENKGAVFNQVNAILPIPDPNSLIMLLDGDDALMPDNNIFNYYNSLFANNKTEYAYGSCWSMADNIPLIAQPYPKKVRDAKAYRTHRFNWNMPYPHLRVFKKRLIDNIDQSVFKDSDGNWFKAGGDNATFYNIIEQADPDKVIAVQDIFYLYNDKNPLNDYKVHGKLQNENAEKIKAAKTSGKQLEKKVEEKMEDRVTNFNDWLKANNKQKENEGIVYSTSPVNANDDIIDKNDMRVVAAAKLMESVRKKKVLIAIPTTKNIDAATFKAIYDQVLPPNITAEFQFFYGYNVDQVRNLIANWIVKGDYDYLFAVDYDIAFPSDTLAKLIAHDKDVVTGVYRQRFHEHQTLEIFEANDRGGFTHIPYEKIKGKIEPVEIGACGFGCVLIKKQVMIDIGYPQFQYHHALDHKDTFSEDLDFARKARAKGFRFWVDPTILCDHTGSYIYRVE